MSRQKQRKRPQGKLVVLRRASQLGFFLLFLALFIKTDYNGTDTLNGAVNILFRLDPFLAACAMLAVKSLIVLFLPAIVVLVVTLVLGRSFCGWFCPMGTLQDMTGKLFSASKKNPVTYFPLLGTLLLCFSVFAAVAGWGIGGYLDPFSLLVRGLAQAIYPWFHYISTSFFTFTYTRLPETVNGLTEPVYALMQETVLPSDQKLFLLPYLSLLMLVVPLVLEKLQRRTFCRNICPLGAFLRLLSFKGLLRGFGGDKKCGKCRLCSTICRMGAIDDTRAIGMGNCNLCFECVDRCPRQVIRFSYVPHRTLAKKETSGLPLSRRQFIGASCAGLLLPTFQGVESSDKFPDPFLIRPPGALAEEAFKGRCLRCAECIQVCVGNALQPSFLKAGVDGIFSPVLVARSGYCEFNCTLCGQVCPSGAIRNISLQEKQQLKIGHAWFDTDLCLPYAKAIPCIVCEEHCPTPEKAIRFKMVEVEQEDGRLVAIKQPYVVDELCIGCGICETKCPLPDRPAIYITNAGEHRHPQRSLPGISEFPPSPY